MIIFSTLFFSVVIFISQPTLCMNVPHYSDDEYDMVDDFETPKGCHSFNQSPNATSTNTSSSSTPTAYDTPPLSHKRLCEKLTIYCTLQRMLNQSQQTSLLVSTTPPPHNTPVICSSPRKPDVSPEISWSSTEEKHIPKLLSLTPKPIDNENVKKILAQAMGIPTQDITENFTSEESSPRTATVPLVLEAQPHHQEDTLPIATASSFSCEKLPNAVTSLTLEENYQGPAGAQQLIALASHLITQINSNPSTLAENKISDEVIHELSALNQNIQEIIQQKFLKQANAKFLVNTNSLLKENNKYIAEISKKAPAIIDYINQIKRCLHHFAYQKNKKE